jgi:hypothetical protein
MDAISKLLSPFLGKTLSLILNDEDETLHVFEWSAIEKEHAKVLEAAKGMTEEQMHVYLDKHRTDLMDLYDYYMDDDCIEKVEQREWIPFGIVGLPHNIDSYAEMDHAGLLLMDVSQNADNPSVVLYLDSEAETIANSLEELDIAEIDEDEDDFDEEDFDEEEELDEDTDQKE